MSPQSFSGLVLAAAELTGHRGVLDDVKQELVLPPEAHLAFLTVPQTLLAHASVRPLFVVLQQRTVPKPLSTLRTLEPVLTKLNVFSKRPTVREQSPTFLALSRFCLGLDNGGIYIPNRSALFFVREGFLFHNLQIDRGGFKRKHIFNFERVA